jgi:hypothetical protein
MNWSRYILMLAISFTLGAAGCESVALMPRPDVDQRPDGERRDDALGRGPSERDRDLATNRRDSTGDVVGTVQRVDERAREIHLRTTEGRTTIVKYSPSTTVTRRDRDLRVEDLRSGDLVLVGVARDSRGDQYAEFIRMNDPG